MISPLGQHLAQMKTASAVIGPLRSWYRTYKKHRVLTVFQRQSFYSQSSQHLVCFFPIAQRLAYIYRERQLSARPRGFPAEHESHNRGTNGTDETTKKIKVWGGTPGLYSRLKRSDIDSPGRVRGSTRCLDMRKLTFGEKSNIISRVTLFNGSP
ncbi:hypothetical protein K504DRAFT_49085 [Pleomassaria siparia CBS 279.74]|uniref:Uncharacterized protein n=1 Tax=Pleomassaria siparia CBS 279.74 TaxID=1314801 RepID=A0A6G1K2E2_9PLEO|nr:hypothetical protein K504DRAFT_49085 [Pleomassaria siparia CBS 279.74]